MADNPSAEKEHEKVDEQRRVRRRPDRFMGPIKGPTIQIAPNYHEMVVDRILRMKLKMTDWELEGGTTYAVGLVRTNRGKLEWWTAA